MADYGELRRLHGNWVDDNIGIGPVSVRKIMEALPGLLDEIDAWVVRMRSLEHEVSTLTSKLALAERALDSANQSITELEAKLLADRKGLGGIIFERGERIAQLEAALQEIRALAIKRGVERGDYADLQGICDAALAAGKEPAK